MSWDVKTNNAAIKPFSNAGMVMLHIRSMHMQNFLHVGGNILYLVLGAEYSMVQY